MITLKALAMRHKISIVFLLSIATFISGCSNRFNDTAAYHSSGRAKPVVAVLPVIDSTSGDKKEYHWDRSEEFTTEIRKYISDSSQLYLLNLAAGMNTAQTLNTPHVSEISEDLLQSLSPAEFAIVSELIDEKVIPYGLRNANASRPHLSDIGSKISIALRVRVIDLRGKEPKIVLQEVIYQDHDVAKAYYNCDYKKCPWGSARYATTPMGIAHAKVIRELVAHVEGYVGL